MNTVTKMFALYLCAWTASSLGQSTLLVDPSGNLTEISAAAPSLDITVRPEVLVLGPGDTARFSATWTRRGGDTLVWRKEGSRLAGAGRGHPGAQRGVGRE